MEALNVNKELLLFGTEVTPLGFDDWVYLNPGDKVVVQRPGYAPQAAVVDDVSEDATYFWLWIEGGSRVLIFEGDATIYLPPGESFLARERISKYHGMIHVAGLSTG
jgi:hypothetical protein